ncbi:uncharacterized protein A4U43_C01F24990 [Asparagus officinalis]|uniref:ELMO domain-containing protein n=1 Tax=Asparagus officinalis TaxID=4686 RepID=A0A5P1FVE4_ASPOF|nr:uncharacterized protein A4U43_C01F24990 [Asparagus officinalis]
MMAATARRKPRGGDDVMDSIYSVVAVVFILVACVELGDAATAVDVYRLSLRIEARRPQPPRRHFSEALRALWRAAFPEVELRGLISEQWKEMGWQGAAFPEVELRGLKLFCTN